jgi:hypothetical protein
LAQAAEHWNSVDNQPREFGGGQTDANDFHAGIRLSLNPLAKLLCRTESADHEDMSEAASVALGEMQSLTGEEVNHQASDNCEQNANCHELQKCIRR